MNTPARPAARLSLLAAIPAIVGLSLFLPLAAHGSTVIYTQPFSSGSGTTNRAVNTVSWNAYIGATATDSSSTSTQGSGVDRTGVIAASGTNTYLYAANGATASQHIALIQSGTAFSSLLASGSLDVSQIGSISWNQGNSATTSQTVRLMIQLDGSAWYASDTVFSNAETYTGATFATAVSSNTADVFKTLSFSTQPSAWRSVSLTSGSVLSLGGIVGTGLSGTVTGIGFYLEFDTGATTNTTMRLDNLVVTAIPEPSALAALLGAGGLMFAVSRRRR